jgi:hypothetical protein
MAELHKNRFGSPKKWGVVVTASWKREMVNIVGISLKYAFEISVCRIAKARFCGPLCFCALHT